MANIKTWAELEKVLKAQAVPMVIQKVSDDVAYVLRRNLLTLFYETHTPQSYDRTYELINSIEVTPIKGGAGKYQAIVKFADGGNHTSWDGTSQSNDEIASYIEYNNPGGRPELANLGYVNTKGARFTEKTADYYNTQFKDAIERSRKTLAKQGIILKVI